MFPALTRPTWGIVSPLIEDRGSVFFDKCTGSTLTKVVAYPRDLKGCGQKDYVFYRAAENLNQRVDCELRATAGLSISGFMIMAPNSLLMFEQQYDALRGLLMLDVGGTFPPPPPTP